MNILHYPEAHPELWFFFPPTRVMDNQPPLRGTPSADHAAEDDRTTVSDQMIRLSLRRRGISKSIPTPTVTIA